MRAMLKKLILVGVVVGSSAAVPILYESNPEAFNSLVTWKGPQPEESASPVEDRQPVQVLAAANPLTSRHHAVSMDGQGHFRDEFRLNGYRTKALIDTGATLVAINASMAQRIGIHLKSSDFIYEVNTANGMTRAAAAKIAKLQIGRIYVENVDAVVLEDSALTGTLIGMSFLKRLQSFQVDNGKLVLNQ